MEHLKLEPCYKIDPNNISEALGYCHRPTSEAPGHRFSRFGTHNDKSYHGAEGLHPPESRLSQRGNEQIRRRVLLLDKTQNGVTSQLNLVHLSHFSASLAQPGTAEIVRGYSNTKP